MRPTKIKIVLFLLKDGSDCQVFESMELPPKGSIIPVKISSSCGKEMF